MNLLYSSSRLLLWIATMMAAVRYVQPFCLQQGQHRFTGTTSSPTLHNSLRRLRITLRIHHQNQSVPTYGGRFASTSSSAQSSCRLFSSSLSDNGTDFREKKRVVFLGTPDVASLALRRLHQDSITSSDGGASYEIVCVITQPAKRRRRKGKDDEASPVGKVAEELGLYLLTPERARDSDFLDHFQRDVRPDLCITAAYGQYLPKRFLATPTLGTVNIHPSLLPRWRGASPVQRSLEAGDNPVGVTVLYTVSKMDAGPIIAQQACAVDENDTATEVLPRLFDIGTDLLIDKLPDLLSGRITMETAREQDESQVVAAAMIDSSEAELKPWEETATTMHNRRRGFSMWPGTFLYLEVGVGTTPTKFKILETRVLKNGDKVVQVDPTDQVQPGPTKKDGLRLVCFDGSVLEILKLQPATKNAVDALSFVNGLQGRTVRYVRTPVESVVSTA